eukprot:TRINITY_DN33768_c0_g1_i1.p1 TRINITY_DN33768_c0_g1~~TRINITY_DN33768_c0_g1_i1.p1  ORF type:complete len:403 (-),score=81.34 TRINITY_DN33768_c0_g1_i1:22-1197(-)
MKIGKGYSPVSVDPERACQVMPKPTYWKHRAAVLGACAALLFVVAFWRSRSEPSQESPPAEEDLQGPPSDDGGKQRTSLASSAALQSTPGGTSEDEPEPPVEHATSGVRVRMPAFKGMEYQLYLPAQWREGGSSTYPVVVFLHGAGDGKFSVMNSQSLPRLLTRNQSTCFDSRSCWCLELEYSAARAKKEAPAGSLEPFLQEEEDLSSPMADCDFAETFPFIVVMPQGWLPQSPGFGWTREKLEQVEDLTRHVLQTYHGDPERVTLTGQSAGGGGAWNFALMRPKLWAAVNVICAPADSSIAEQLEGLDIWVVGWTGDGIMGNDEVVAALKQRKAGSVRYTRYLKAPGPPDPKYRHMLHHASYDLIYRDPRLWTWALAQHRPEATALWRNA